MHGSFWYDPYRNWNTRGVVNPRGVSNATGVLSKAMLAASSAKATYRYTDYTVWNTTIMAVVVAGNSTLQVTTHNCPIEGCNAVQPKTQKKAHFRWSDNATWIALNVSVPCHHEPTASNGEHMCMEDYPCGCGDVTIFEDWTVILDVSTPFLNTLTVRPGCLVQITSILLSS